jgi:hypothetical protein
MRSMASPHFEIRPDQSISPEAWRRVVNPIGKLDQATAAAIVGNQLIA